MEIRGQFTKVLNSIHPGKFVSTHRLGPLFKLLISGTPTCTLSESSMDISRHFFFLEGPQIWLMSIIRRLPQSFIKASFLKRRWNIWAWFYISWEMSTFLCYRFSRIWINKGQRKDTWVQANNSNRQLGLMKVKIIRSNLVIRSDFWERERWGSEFRHLEFPDKDQNFNLAYSLASRKKVPELQKSWITMNGLRVEEMNESTNWNEFYKNRWNVLKC